ncbi:hypothetical protein TVAG_070870 [Trichomonas vaginalis G3]|uniref:Uncharacterized protein n=1 Tax=Trichomonas vaginalis (strain ATCC PRA-98 / G3) TaxID=412133 RepID=A2D7Z0_TRIV3|nr:hypothetical protein TVAGG3_1045490 [Trichomonas vaginalis G3]EAY23423.1 hypothetical protein TVAG_070870 [Trichomonas vaginalis G3]KAI5493836.1 hypothetical protein TVAGG3_1045490 [Trichomonas vaginalis G3]|eukprot:XP_001584409.1 hypothetical protein [Trichomonas vaginalis G3]
MSVQNVYFKKIMELIVKNPINPNDPFLKFIAKTVEFEEFTVYCIGRIHNTLDQSTKSHYFDLVCMVSLIAPKQIQFETIYEFLEKFDDFPSFENLINLSNSLGHIFSQQTKIANHSDLKQILERSPAIQGLYGHIIISTYARHDSNAYNNIFNEILLLINESQHLNYDKLLAINILLEKNTYTDISKENIQRFVNILSKKANYLADMMKSDDLLQITLILELIAKYFKFFKGSENKKHLINCFIQLQYVYNRFKENPTVIRDVVDIMINTPVGNHGSLSASQQINFFFELLVSKTCESFIVDPSEDFRIDFVKERLLSQNEIETAVITIKMFKHLNFNYVLKLVTNTVLCDEEKCVEDVYYSILNIEKNSNESNADFEARKATLMQYTASSFKDFFKNCKNLNSFETVLIYFFEFTVKSDYEAEIKEAIQYLSLNINAVIYHLMKKYHLISNPEIQWEFISFIAQNIDKIRPVTDDMSEHYDFICELLYQYGIEKEEAKKDILVKVFSSIFHTKLENPSIITLIFNSIINPKEFDEFLCKNIKSKKSFKPIVVSAAYFHSKDNKNVKSKSYDLSVEYLHDNKIKTNYLPELKTIYYEFYSILFENDMEKSSDFILETTQQLTKTKSVKMINHELCIAYAIAKIIANYIEIKDQIFQKLEEAFKLIMFHYNPQDFIKENASTCVSFLECDREVDSEILIKFSESVSLCKHYKEICNCCENPASLICRLIDSYSLCVDNFPQAEEFCQFCIDNKNDSELLHVFCRSFCLVPYVDLSLRILSYVLTKSSCSPEEKAKTMRPAIFLSIRYTTETNSLKIPNDLVLRPVFDFFNSFLCKPFEKSDIMTAIGNNLDSRDITDLIFQYIVNQDIDDSRLLLLTIICQKCQEKIDDKTLVNIFSVKLSNSPEIDRDLISLLSQLLKNDPDRCILSAFNSRNIDISTKAFINCCSLSSKFPHVFVTFVTHHKSICTVSSSLIVSNILKKGIMTRIDYGDIFFSYCIICSRLNQFPDEIDIDGTASNQFVQDFIEFVSSLEIDVSAKLLKVALSHAKDVCTSKQEIFNHASGIILSLPPDFVISEIVESLFNFDVSDLPESLREFLHRQINKENVVSFISKSTNNTKSLLMEFGLRKDICLVLLNTNTNLALEIIKKRVVSNHNFGFYPYDNLFILGANGNQTAADILLIETNTKNFKEMFSILLARDCFMDLNKIVESLISTKALDCLITVLMELNSLKVVSQKNLLNATIVLSQEPRLRNNALNILLLADKIST